MFIVVVQAQDNQLRDLESINPLHPPPLVTLVSQPKPVHIKPSQCGSSQRCRATAPPSDRARRGTSHRAKPTPQHMPPTVPQALDVPVEISRWACWIVLIPELEEG